MQYLLHFEVIESGCNLSEVTGSQYFHFMRACSFLGSAFLYGDNGGPFYLIAQSPPENCRF